MNRTDQKYALNEIIMKMEEIISQLKDHTVYYMMRVEDFTKLYENLEENGFNVFSVTVIEFMYELSAEIFRSVDLDVLQDELDTFSNDIDELMDNVSEVKQDKLLERYGDLTDICDSIRYEENYINVSDMIDTLEEKLQWIVQMKK